MNHPSKRSGVPDYIRLRKCLLLTLYERFKQFPYAVVEPQQLEADCRTTAGELNWNLVYMEKSGWVELGKSIECPPYIATSVALSASGIELVENESEFGRRFPEQHSRTSNGE